MEHISNIVARAARANERQKRTPTASAALSDGRLVEMVMRNDVTALAVWHGDRWELVSELVLDDGRMLVPYSPQNNLLAHGVVKLASGPEEYGSDTDPRTRSPSAEAEALL